MSFLRFLLCIALGAVLGAVGGFFAILAFVEGFDRLTGYVMSEGGLGTLAVAILAGLAWGLLAGNLSAGRVRSLAGAAAAALALTLGGILLVLGLAAAVAYAGLPAPVRIDGRRVVLAFEIMAPAGAARPQDAGPGWRVQVESWHGRYERQRATLEWDKARRDGDRLRIPGYAPVGNPGKRSLTLYCEAYLSGSRRELPLPVEPSRADMAWNDWQVPPERASRDGGSRCGYPLRYRLRFADDPH